MPLYPLWLAFSESDEQYAIEHGQAYDKSAKWANAAEPIAESVANSDLGDLEADMLAAFDAIPVGYFNDEAADDE